MLCDIIKAEYIEDYKLRIFFENGNSGIVDFSHYPAKGGVFSNFKNLSYFKNFIVSEELGTIVWDGEVDIAPETLYEKCEPEAFAISE